jgi:hypothetical protein
MNIDPKNTTAIKCEKCECETFREVVFIRKASKLLTGQATDSVMPIPTFQCSSCGHINKEFTPKF